MIPAIRDFPIYCFQIPEVPVSSHALDPEFAEEVYRFSESMRLMAPCADGSPGRDSWIFLLTDPTADDR